MRELNARQSWGWSALGCVAVALLAPAPAGAATLFTSEASFVGAIQPGYYLEDFEGLPATYGPLPSPQSFSGGAQPYAYTVASTLNYADSALYVISPFTKALSVRYSYDDLVVDLTGANATAVGGFFYITDYNGIFASGTISLSLSDGSSATVSSPSDPLGLFRGFTTGGATYITSLTIHSVNTSGLEWPTMDRFYVGTAAVPEPQAAALLAGLGLIGYVAQRRRRDR